MTPYFETPEVTLWNGDCREVMAGLPEASIDAVVCDPPYHLTSKPGGDKGFMGKAWDGGDVAFRPETWKLAYDAMKPGAHLLAFGGTRTYHRLACAIEDAGFEIREQIMWIFASGFPKSLDVSKAIDKAAGVEREVVGAKSAGFSSLHRVARVEQGYRENLTNVTPDSLEITAPATEAAKQWQGWGSAMKPAVEPIVLARKPLVGTIAANVQAHGTGALNIDGCRVPSCGEKLGGGNNSPSVDRRGKHEGWRRPWMEDEVAAARSAERSQASTARSESLGRWPANLCHDGSDEVMEAFAAYGERGGHGGGTRTTALGRMNDDAWKPSMQAIARPIDSGTAARFFFCAKASKEDRSEGNAHPTVKPTALMRWLCRLITPPGGLILDPFMGSGSTGKAAILEGFRFAGIEREAEYCEIAKARIQGTELPLFRRLA